MNFIKKIFEGKAEGDESVHLQFQKFSRGEFRDKALIKIKNSKGGFNISTSYEFANELVRSVAEKTMDKKTSVAGVIVSTNDLNGKLDFQNKKQFMGVKQYVIKKDMDGKEIIELLDKFPRAFFALSFKTEGDELKIKPKAPKSAKPGSKGGEKPKADFCKLKTNDAELVKELVFEKPNFKTAEISHKFIIDEIIPPKDEKDFAKIRELAKRKGKIIRTAVIDSVEFKSEKVFEV